MHSPDTDFPHEQYFATRAWLVVALAGLLVAGISLPLQQLFPQESYAVQSGYGPPIFALEMARSAEDIDAVLGPPGDPFREQRASQMDRGNRFDFVFLTIYSAFMAAFFVATYRATGHRRWFAPVVLAIAAGACDAVENYLLFGIVSGEKTEAWIGLLPYAVWGKFFAIMICILLAARYIQKSRSGVLVLLGWVAIAGALSVAAARYAPAQYGWLLGYGIGAGWLVMALYALLRALKSSRLQRARSV